MRIERFCGQPFLLNEVTITKLEPCGTSGQPAGGSQITLIALKRPSVPGPPWMGILRPLRVTFSNGMTRMRTDGSAGRAPAGE